MAIRTQIRLPQITGSLGTGSGQISDQLTANTATGSINAADLTTVLSHMASAIKKIHGADSFSEQQAGAFSQQLTIADAGGLTLGTGGSELDISEDGSGNVTIDTTTSNADLIFTVNDEGSADTEVLRIDGSASSLLMDTNKKIEFRDPNSFINSSAANTLDIEATETINIGTDTSGVAITIGNSTSEVTVADNLTVSGDAVVTGDLTVNGTTTTVNTTNLEVTDAVILLASGAAGSTPSKDMGLIMERQGGNIGFYWEETGDLMKLGFTNDYADDNALAAASEGMLTFQVDKLQITGSNYTIAAEDIGSGNATLNVTSANQVALLSAHADANAKVQFGATAAQDTIVAMSIDMSKNTLATIQDSGNNDMITIDGTNTRVSMDNLLLISGSNQISFNSVSANDVLLGSNTQGELYMTGSVGFVVENSDSSKSGLISIKSGSSGAALGFDFGGNASITYSWPNAPAANDYYLKSQTDGTLAWADLGSISIPSRFTFKITGPIAAGDVDFGGTPSSGVATINNSVELDITTSDANLNAGLAVYVNGTLLMSGANGGTDTDYTFVNNETLNFAFGLEDGDIVQIIEG